MNLTKKEIKESTFRSIGGYSAEDVDNFLDKVEADYEELEKIFSNGEIYISSKFKGELMPKSVVYEGTIAQWKAIENKGIFENIPCINCKDGMHIQRL